MESHSLTLDEACAFLKISRPTASSITGESLGRRNLHP